MGGGRLFLVKHEAKREAKHDAEAKSKAKSASKRSQGGSGRRSNWIPVVALLLLAVAAVLVYSGLTTPLTTALQSTERETLSGVQTVFSRPTAPPQNNELKAQFEVGGTPTPLPSGAGDCKLFKNKYTSEFKCISCVVGVNNPNAVCVYASRDWVEVASGTSGYSCEYEAILELGCKTIKA